jgi:hypothetical protein
LEPCFDDDIEVNFVFLAVIEDELVDPLKDQLRVSGRSKELEKLDRLRVFEDLGDLRN